MKKALIISNQGLSTLHLGIELEVIEKISNNFNEIVYATCGVATISCFFNPTGNPIGCAICQTRNIKFHKLLTADNVSHMPFPNEKVDEWYTLLKNDSETNIEDWHVNHVNIGRGILSSVISLKRDYNVLTDQIKPLIDEELKVALKSLIGFEKLNSLVQPDEVFVFNGRFSETFPIISYCKHHGVVFHTIEVGATNQKFEIFTNHLPHSIIARQRNMWQLWENAPENKYNVAEKWFFDKIEGKHKDDKNYTEHQHKSLLPENFDNSRYNISIFNSSEDEMKTIDEWQHDMYSTQNEAIKKIVWHFQNNTDIHFYLRMHPNLANLNNTQVNEALAFNSTNFTLIPSTDPIDTYALIDASDMIISFGSTVGIEATFKNKVSVMLGKSFYSGMKAVYEPQTFEETYYMIQNGTKLTPMPKENALPYAYYVSSRGENYKHFEYKDKFESFYRKIKMKRFYFFTILLTIFYGLKIKRYIRKFYILYNRNPSVWDLKKLKI